MLSPEMVVQVLRGRGELWESAPGLVGMRGDALALYGALERRIADLAREETGDEWRVPAGVSFRTLSQADYFASLPQWLTVASHLSEDAAALKRVATHADPAAEVRASLAPAGAALLPAVCYHTYEALKGRVVASPTLMTAQGTCWRHEGPRLRPLERGWAFTMREIVCLGTPEEIERFRRRGVEIALRLASSLGLASSIEVAKDPFFAPTARGKALLQKIKSLKYEMMLPLEPGRSVAAASFNHHETFFGEAFDIRLPDGQPAASGCVAFGIERWLLAFLCTHGTDAAEWPPLQAPELVHTET